MKLLKQGDTGSAVTFLQTRLSALGHHVEPDSAFGPLTAQAVEQLQATLGLRVDGVVGPQTWDALLVAERVENPFIVGEVANLMNRAKTALEGSPRAAERGSVLWCAINDIGCREQPSGSNEGPQIGHLLRDSDQKSYWDYCELPEEGRPPAPPWCMIAVSSWLRIGLSGGTIQPPDNPEPSAFDAPLEGVLGWADIPFKARFGAVAQVEAWALAAGFDVWQDIMPAGVDIYPYVEAGSVFTMGRAGSGSDAADIGAVKAGHCGFVVADDGDYVVTVEGNSGNAVGWRRRPKSSLRGTVCWWRSL